MSDPEEKKLQREYALSKERLMGLGMAGVLSDFEKRLDQAIAYEQAQEDCSNAFTALATYRKNNRCKP